MGRIQEVRKEKNLEKMTCFAKQNSSDGDLFISLILLLKIPQAPKGTPTLKHLLLFMHFSNT